MPRRPVVFRQADLQRALRAAKAAGVEVTRIEIEPVTGKIVMITSAGTATVNDNPLDQWLASRARPS